MRLRIATFNVENLFERPRAMNRPTWKEGQAPINDCNELNQLFNKKEYSLADKKHMLKLLEKHGLSSRYQRNDFLLLRQIRGKLMRRSQNTPPEIVAKGRDDWIGWVELKKESIRDKAIENTAKVIAEVNPDVLVLVEIEHRPVLQHFLNDFLEPIMLKNGKEGYPYNMVIDGNDERGIDVGIMSRRPITKMRSHIQDRVNGKRVFSRDCPEYFISLDHGVEIVVLPNHFSSKGSDYQGKRRCLQARKVREIYQELRRDYEHVIVAGDLNDYPGGGSLNDLLGTDLTDVMSLDCYNGLPGTYKHASQKEKLDYLMLSPKLTDKVIEVDVFRKGFYAPTKWKPFDNLNKKTKNRYRASDHHCLWADIEI